jgi:MinD superfamily P-loop ATPase
MIIAVASGKGGTGKTTVAVNLALALGSVHFLDCDVEEPNAHLFLKPRLTEQIPVTVPVPEVDIQKCTGCGKCGEVCARTRSRSHLFFLTYAMPAVPALSCVPRGLSGRSKEILV